MLTNKTYHYMVRCKCPGALGVGRISVNYTENRAGYDFFVHVRDNMYAATACWACRRYFKIAGIDGKVGHQECGAKCQGSKGPSCECKCGGKNHGMSYAA